MGQDRFIDGMVDTTNTLRKPAKRSMADFEVGGSRTRVQKVEPVRRVESDRIFPARKVNSEKDLFEKRVRQPERKKVESQSFQRTVPRNISSSIHEAGQKTPEPPKLTREQIADDFVKPVEPLKIIKTPDQVNSSSRTLGEVPVSASMKRRGLTSEEIYKRDILGLSDDEIEMDSDDVERDLRAERAKLRELKRNRRKYSFFTRHKKLFLVVLPIVVVFFLMFSWGDSIVRHITGGQSGLFDFLRSAIFSSATLKKDEKGRTNFLVFGTSGYDMEGHNGEETHDGAQLTDSIMAISVNQSTGDVSMISIPRDLKVDTCTSVGKINEVFNCENPNGDREKAGAEALMKKVSEVLGISMQYYVHLDWTALIQIVNALGGISVTIDENIADDWTGTFISAGVPTELNGEQALGLARARHGTDGGDFTRGASQQKIIMALVDKIRGSSMGASEIFNLANIFGDNLRTSMSSDEIMAGVKFFTSTTLNIRQVPLTGWETNYLTTGDIYGTSYVFPEAGVGNYEAIHNYINDSLSADPLKVESARIMILNGSGEDGLAAREQEALTNAGLNVVAIGNAPAGDYLEPLYIYNLTDKTITLEKLKAYYNTEFSLSREALPEGIDPTDLDFVIILGVGYQP